MGWYWDRMGSAEKLRFHHNLLSHHPQCALPNPTITICWYVYYISHPVDFVIPAPGSLPSHRQPTTRTFHHSTEFHSQPPRYHHIAIIFPQTLRRDDPNDVYTFCTKKACVNKKKSSFRFYSWDAWLLSWCIVSHCYCAPHQITLTHMVSAPLGGTSTAFVHFTSHLQHPFIR